jgi:hypothetical protein
LIAVGTGDEKGSWKQGNTTHTCQALFSISKVSTVNEAMNVLPGEGIFWRRYNVA